MHGVPKNMTYGIALMLDNEIGAIMFTNLVLEGCPLDAYHLSHICEHC